MRERQKNYVQDCWRASRLCWREMNEISKELDDEYKSRTNCGEYNWKLPEEVCESCEKAEVDPRWIKYERSERCHDCIKYWQYAVIGVKVGRKKTT